MKRYEILVFKDRTIKFTLERRPNRHRTLTVKVTRKGEVVVLAPPRMSPATIRDFVTDRVAWIDKQIAAADKRLVERLFITGETVPFLGRALPLRVESAQIKRVRLPVFEEGALNLLVPAQAAGEERTEFIKRCLKLWYRPRAEKRLREAAFELADKMGRAPAAVNVKDLISSWGICRDNNISLNWRLIMTPKELIEYVVYHELCHLEHRGHGQDFRRALSEFVPDHKDRRRALGDIDLDWI